MRPAFRPFPLAIVCAVPFALAAAGCKPAAKPTAEKAGDAALGRQVYMANCIACHAADPSKDGPLGPAIAGSTLELLTARVLSTQYPPGYAPKRTTKIMTPLPFLKGNLKDLEAFLAETPDTSRETPGGSR